MEDVQARAEDGSDDRPLDQLDDRADREELRSRYYGLLQELRVVLPGVQVLLAFLLTVPFADRFEELDATGRDLYGVALLFAALSVLCLLTPTVLHRVGDRTARGDRLRWGIRLAVVGVGGLAVSTTAAIWCVARLVFSPTLAGAMAIAVGATIVVLWVALPRTLDHDGARGRSAQSSTSRASSGGAK